MASLARCDAATSVVEVRVEVLVEDEDDEEVEVEVDVEVDLVDVSVRLGVGSGRLVALELLEEPPTLDIVFIPTMLLTYRDKVALDTCRSQTLSPKSIGSSLQRLRSFCDNSHKSRRWRGKY